MQSHSQPLVSVVIPTRNAGSEFRQALEAIRAQQIPGDLEILAIDSHSKDGTAQLASKYGARVVSIPQRQFNHGRTRNHGIRACKGEFVALTVQDALPVDEQWLAHLLTPLLEQPEVAGSYGLQLAPPNSGLLARTLSSMWCERNSAPAIKSLSGPEEWWEMSPEKRLELIRFDDVTSCIRRSTWERIPLPEHNYGEDMGWAKQVLREGQKVAFVPSAKVWHAHEREPRYHLRRAYVDGYTRVRLVDWPSPTLTFIDVAAMLRRMIFFLRTRRFDAMVEPAIIRRFLAAEIYHYEPQCSAEPARIYLQVLRFALALTDRASSLCSGGTFPHKAWIELFRFAMVTVVGQHLGAAAALTREQSWPHEKVAWNIQHWFLGQGV